MRSTLVHTCCHPCTKISHDERHVATGLLNEGYYFQYSWREKNNKREREKIGGAGEGEMGRESGGFAGSFDWKSGDKAFRSWDLAL